MLRRTSASEKTDPARLADPQPGSQVAVQAESCETPAFAQRHYSVAEVAKMWSLSPDLVRRLFEREPGVLVIGDAEGRAGKRRYTTLRIPQAVLERVHRRLARP